jgi:hypothetical protein
LLWDARCRTAVVRLIGWMDERREEVTGIHGAGSIPKRQQALAAFKVFRACLAISAAGAQRSPVLYSLGTVSFLLDGYALILSRFLL